MTSLLVLADFIVKLWIRGIILTGNRYNGFDSWMIKKERKAVSCQGCGNTRAISHNKMKGLMEILHGKLHFNLSLKVFGQRDVQR